MANMSYCRFRNTYMDIEDCLYALDMEEELSEEEAKACDKMFKSFLAFAEEMGFAYVNWDGYEKWVKEIKEKY